MLNFKIRGLLCVLLVGFIFGAGVWVCEPQAQTTGPEFIRTFVSLDKIRKGQSREEVVDLLGAKIVIGYTLSDPAQGVYQPVVQENPFRTQTVARGSRTYIVDYYLVAIRAADDRVADDELGPLVFLNNRLIGFGWDFLNKKLQITKARQQ